jgi:hypothetical protein
LAALGAGRLPFGAYITFDTRSVMFGLIAAIVLRFVLAAPIAWFNLRFHPANALQSEARVVTAGRAAQALRHSFIVAQIGLAFVLLAGAGLLGLSLKRAMALSPGFRSDHVITGQISLVGNKYPSPSAALAFTERLVDELGHQPGAQRRREIAVRMALGARPEQIRGQFLSLALRLLAGGTILGVVGAWLTGRAMQAFLFHVPAHSPAILAGSASIIAVVSLAACLLPAHQAARISPTQALADQ